MLLTLPIEYQNIPLICYHAKLAEYPHINQILDSEGGLSVSADDDFVILRTCMRTVIFVRPKNPATVRALDQQLLPSGFRKIEGFCPTLLYASEIFSGLDSQFLGEPHIMGQGARAFARAGRGTVLWDLGFTALKIAARTRFENSFNQTQTYPQAAVAMARQRLSGQGDTTLASNLCVFGTGIMGQSAAKAGKDAFAHVQLVTTRPDSLDVINGVSLIQWKSRRRYPLNLEEESAAIVATSDQDPGYKNRIIRYMLRQPGCRLVADLGSVRADKIKDPRYVHIHDKAFAKEAIQAVNAPYRPKIDAVRQGIETRMEAIQWSGHRPAYRVA